MSRSSSNFGQLGRVHDHAAFGPAVGQAHEGALPTHPHGEGGDLAEGHVLVESDTALGGAGGEVVLNAISFEDGHTAVIALNRECYGETTAGVFGAIAERFGEVDGVRRLVELAAGHFERRRCIQRRDNDF